MIKRVSLHNFKSISNVDIQLDRLTVLIGRSGTGKTNIVEALRFWRDFLSERNFHRLTGHKTDSWSRILSATVKDRSFSFQVEFTVEDAATSFVYQIAFAFQPGDDRHPYLVDEALHVQGKTIFHQHDRKWIQPPKLLEVPQPGDVALGALYGLPEAKIAYLVLTRGLGCYDFPGDVLQGSESRHQDQMKRSSTGFQDDGSNYLEVFSEISSDFSSLGSSREIESAIRQLNPTVQTLEFEAIRNRILVGHQLDGGPVVTLSLNQQSEGFRRFLAHLLAVHQIPPKPTLVFEEAEKGIYPGALATLADVFKATTSSGRSQIILTTHSPQLLDHFPVDSIRVVEMKDYQTRVGPVSPEQLEAVRENLMTTGELLSADPARIAC